MPNPTQYQFIQQVDYSEVLASGINASSITTPLLYINTDGSGPSMSVSIWFNSGLSETEVITLNNVLAVYVNNAPVQPASFGAAILRTVTLDVTVPANVTILERDPIITDGVTVTVASTGELKIL